MGNTISNSVRTFSQAARLMIRQPRFFLVTVLVLALGIGTSTALFSVMYGVLLKPLPVQQQDRLVVGWKGDPKDIAHVGELSRPEFQDWQQQSKTFEQMAAMPTTVYGYGLTLTGYGEPAELERTPVSAAFFSLLGVRPALGRTFEESDDRPGAEPTVVLHDSVWRNHFHADLSVIGKIVSLSGRGYTIIGVMPPGFDFPEGAQLWTPLGLNAQWDRRGATFLQVIGRLKPGVSLQQSKNDAADVMAHVTEQYPQYSEPGEFAVVTPLTDYIFGSNKPAILLLWAASLLLLGIACINISSLLLARAIVREKEIAIRLALGATRKDLFRQFIAEGLVLSSAGAVAGCAFARVLVAAVIQLAPPGIPRLSSVNLNVFSLLFASVISLAIAVAFALAPAFFVMRRDVRDSLNENGTRTAGSLRGTFFRRSLLVAEAVVTLLLLTSAGMVVHNFYNLQRVRLGFVPENTLTAQINLANVDANHRKVFFSDLLERLRLHPEVNAVGAVLLRPFEGNVGWDVPYKLRGQSAYEAKKNPVSNFEVVTPGYFQAVGTPLVAGRYFALGDNDKNQNVAIISEALARKAFANVRQSVGEQISLGSADAPGDKDEWCTIVGVVADAQYRKLGVTQGDIFIPFLQTNIPVRYVAMRADVNPASLVPILREEVKAIDKAVAVSKVGTMEQLIAQAKTGPRFSMLLFSMFGIFAGFLASVGVYGLVSDSVVQRRREIGIRMALGAQRKSVLFLLIQGEMSAVTLGGFLGVLFSLGMVHAYMHLLYGLQGIDFLSLAIAFAILISVSLATSIVPTLNATRAPVTKLLSE
jgi:putative ABC transport system permease protein